MTYEPSRAAQLDASAFCEDELSASTNLLISYRGPSARTGGYRPSQLSQRSQYYARLNYNARNYAELLSLRERLAWLDTGAALRFFELTEESAITAERALAIYTSAARQHGELPGDGEVFNLNRLRIEEEMPSALETLEALEITTTTADCASPTESFRRHFAIATSVPTGETLARVRPLYASQRPDFPFYAVLQNAFEDSLADELVTQACLIYFVNDEDWKYASSGAQDQIARLLEDESSGSLGESSSNRREQYPPWWLAESDLLNPSDDQADAIDLLPANWRARAPWSWPETGDSAVSRQSQLRFLLRAYMAVALKRHEIVELAAAKIGYMNASAIEEVAMHYNSIRDEVRNWGQRSEIWH